MQTPHLAYSSTPLCRADLSYLLLHLIRHDHGPSWASSRPHTCLLLLPFTCSGQSPPHAHLSDHLSAPMSTAPRVQSATSFRVGGYLTLCTRLHRCRERTANHLHIIRATPLISRKFVDDNKPSTTERMTV